MVHDVGKSDGFRKVVNDSLPFDLRSDDHDRALACALTDPELKRKLLPTVARLSPARQEAILAGGERRRADRNRYILYYMICYDMI